MCCLLKTVIKLIFLRICINHSQHYEMRKNSSELNFPKNRRTSWFSQGWLKISKCSIHSPNCASTQKVKLHHWVDLKIACTMNGSWYFNKTVEGKWYIFRNICFVRFSWLSVVYCIDDCPTVLHIFRIILVNQIF